MKSKRAERRFLIVLIGLFIILLPCTGYTAIPQKINYQGYLTSAAGVPVNGTVQILFSIYDVPAAGVPLWTETQNALVNHGVYNVTLGDVNLITLPFNTQYFLGVKVGTDPEMTPRIPLTSIGYAFRAQTVDSVGSHTHSGADITSGTVLEPRIDSAIARTSALNAHTSNTNNPHSTTAVQVGAAPSVHSHSGADITSGTVLEPRIDSAIARTSALNAHTSNTNNPHSTTASQVGAVDLSTAQTVGGTKTFSSPIGSTVATGTAPLQVASTTMVMNLNAERVGGYRIDDLDSRYGKVAPVQFPRSNTISTIDPEIPSGYTSISIGMDGLPIISFHDGSNRTLRVAHCGNVACSSGNSVHTIDPGFGADVGQVEFNRHRTGRFARGLLL